MHFISKPNYMFLAVLFTIVFIMQSVSVVFWLVKCLGINYKVSSIISIFTDTYTLKDGNLACSALYSSLENQTTSLHFLTSKSTHWIADQSDSILSCCSWSNGKILILSVFFPPLQVPSPNWAHYRYHTTVYQQQMTWNI